MEGNIRSLDALYATDQARTLTIQARKTHHEHVEQILQYDRLLYLDRHVVQTLLLGLSFGLVHAGAGHDA